MFENLFLGQLSPFLPKGECNSLPPQRKMQSIPYFMGRKQFPITKRKWKIKKNEPDNIQWV